MKTSEVLNLAADQIEQRGWVVGGNGWNTGSTEPLCLEGGLMAAMGLNWLEFANDTHSEFRTCPAYTAVQEYLELANREHINGDGLELWRWNDNEAEDSDHVISVLRAVALVEAAKEAALEGALP